MQHADGRGPHEARRVALEEFLENDVGKDFVAALSRSGVMRWDRGSTEVRCLHDAPARRATRARAGAVRDGFRLSVRCRLVVVMMRSLVQRRSDHEARNVHEVGAWSSFLLPAAFEVADTANPVENSFRRSEFRGGGSGRWVLNGSGCQSGLDRPASDFMLQLRRATRHLETTEGPHDVRRAFG